jgi:hypothetical protein
VVKAAVEECSVQARSRCRERGRRGRGGLVRRGGVEAPFYRVGGEQDGWTERGIERSDGVALVVAEWRHHFGRFGLEWRRGNDEGGGEAARVVSASGRRGADGEAAGCGGTSVLGREAAAAAC